jgi:hypothetical protein
MCSIFYIHVKSDRCFRFNLMFSRTWFLQFAHLAHEWTRHFALGLRSPWTSRI